MDEKDGLKNARDGYDFAKNIFSAVVGTFLNADKHQMVSAISALQERLPGEFEKQIAFFRNYHSELLTPLAGTDTSGNTIELRKTPLFEILDQLEQAVKLYDKWHFEEFAKQVFDVA